MTTEEFITSLQKDPKSNTFATTLEVINQYYSFTPTGFRNGNLENQAGENNGSCRIFAFAQLHGLDPATTLACFGDFYFKEVLRDPEGDGHQNIRNFMKTGWKGIEFNGIPLKAK